MFLIISREKFPELREYEEFALNLRPVAYSASLNKSAISTRLRLGFIASASHRIILKLLGVDDDIPFMLLFILLGI